MSLLEDRPQAPLAPPPAGLGLFIRVLSWILIAASVAIPAGWAVMHPSRSVEAGKVFAWSVPIYLGFWLMWRKRRGPLRAQLILACGLFATLVAAYGVAKDDHARASLVSILAMNQAAMDPRTSPIAVTAPLAGRHDDTATIMRQYTQTVSNLMASQAAFAQQLAAYQSNLILSPSVLTDPPQRDNALATVTKMEDLIHRAMADFDSGMSNLDRIMATPGIPASETEKYAKLRAANIAGMTRMNDINMNVARTTRDLLEICAHVTCKLSPDKTLIFGTEAALNRFKLDMNELRTLAADDTAFRRQAVQEWQDTERSYDAYVKKMSD